MDNLGIEKWRPYGVGVIGEQTVYKMQGPSHTSRHASIELRYAELTGGQSRVPEAVRQLNWCIYAVDHDGNKQVAAFRDQRDLVERRLRRLHAAFSAGDGGTSRTESSSFPSAAHIIRCAMGALCIENNILYHL